MRQASQFVFVLALALTVHPAVASDLAVLRNGFTIRHERREVLGNSTRLYLGADTAGYIDVPTTEIVSFEKDPTPPPAAPAPKPQDMASVIGSASDHTNLDPALINSVIRAESGFNPKAVSRKGAVGLMQLMPGTASQLGVKNPFDPSANVEGGSRYLRELLDRYNLDLVKALAAYNAGPQRVQQFGGVPPYYETQAYVARIIRDFNRQKQAEKKAVAKAKAGKTSKPAAASPTASTPSNPR